MPVGPLPVDLDECTGQLLRFPGCTGFACAQPHGDILHPHRLAWTKREVTDDPVALVEQTQHGDALGHGRYPRLVSRSARHVDSHGLVFGSLVAAAAPARGQQQGKRKEGGTTSHAYSGFHAS